MESRSARAVAGRADQQGPPRRRPQVPSTGARPDRGASRRQPPVRRCPREGSGPGTSRASADPTSRGRWRQGVLVPGQPRPPAAARHQRGHPREDRPGRQPEAERPLRRPARQSRHRALQGPEHRRTPDQQAEGLAGHRDPVRQDPPELPRRSLPPRFHDLDQRPHPSHPMITTRYAP